MWTCTRPEGVSDSSGRVPLCELTWDERVHEEDNGRSIDCAIKMNLRDVEAIFGKKFLRGFNLTSDFGIGFLIGLSYISVLK
jgi:hypothetical protein